MQKEENGKFKFNPDVPFDSKNDHGVYSKNNGNFPFALRPYKYMLLRQGRTAKADVMLLELTEPDKWEVLPITKLNEDGDLWDPYSEKEVVLLHASDILLSKEMDETEFVDDTVALWDVVYKIMKVLKIQTPRHNPGRLHFRRRLTSSPPPPKPKTYIPIRSIRHNHASAQERHFPTTCKSGSKNPYICPDQHPITVKRPQKHAIALIALIAAALLASCGTSQSWGKKKPRYGGCHASALIQKSSPLRNISLLSCVSQPRKRPQNEALNTF